MVRFGKDLLLKTKERNKMEQPNRHPWMGKIAKDKVTGFTGRVTGYCQCLTGCDSLAVTPTTCKEGAYPNGQYIDINRLELVPDSDTLELDTSVVKGAMDMPAVK